MRVYIKLRSVESLKGCVIHFCSKNTIFCSIVCTSQHLCCQFAVMNVWLTSLLEQRELVSTASWEGLWLKGKELKGCIFCWRSFLQMLCIFNSLLQLIIMKEQRVKSHPCWNQSPKIFIPLRPGSQGLYTGSRLQGWGGGLCLGLGL